MATTDPHYLPSEVFATIVANTPLISIDLIVKNSSGEVLLGERLNAPARGFWFTPGGRIYKNESMRSAFKRIAYDELGLIAQIEDATFIGTFEHFYDDSIFGDHITTHYVVLAYALNHSQLKIKNSSLLGDQHNAYRWQSIDTLLADETVHPHVKWYFTR